MNPAQLLNPKAFAKEQAKGKKKSPNYGPTQSRKPTSSSPSGTHFDPRALLSPRAAGPSTSMNADGIDHNAGSLPNNAVAFSNNDESVGAGNLYEAFHQLQDREDVPGTKRKAQTIEDSTSDVERKKAKSNFSRPNGGGVLGEHMKGELKKHAETIDLTNDDDGAADDDVQIIKANDKAEVCLGVIKASCNAYRIPNVSQGAQRQYGRDMYPPFRCEISRSRTDTKIIDLLDKQGNKFATVEPKLAAALVPILQGSSMSKARIKVFVPARIKKADEFPLKKVSTSIKIDVVLYSPKDKAKSIGRFLSQKQLFLTNPSMNTGFEIYNPHVPTDFGPPKPVARKPQPSAPTVQRSAEEIRREASNMFDNLAQNAEISEMDAKSEIIKSELMSHQKQALRFMVEHEREYEDMELPTHTLWKYQPKKTGQDAWYNIITGSEVLEKPRETRGGILADVMGLGKTLSILSLIAETRDEARRSRRQPVPEDVDAERNAAGTLIVCPKSVLSNFQEQIKIHLTDSSILVYTYHGKSRTQDLRALSKYDIVLTSYNTAATEFGPGSRKYSALADLNWFRIVLDEAHSARNTTTNISKACCALNTARRWAVTGTPVQNSLADLGALFRFIRLQPFDEPAVWATHINAPFKLGDADVIEKLQVLVGSVTLRRGKSTIHLPDRKELRERLTFSDDEALLYKKFATRSRSQLHRVTGGGNALRGKAYAHILKSLSRLRAICAHGREMLAPADLEEVENDDPNNAIVIDLGDEKQTDDFVSERQAYETFHMMQESDVCVCVSCNKNLVKDTARHDGEVDEDETTPEATEDGHDTDDEVDETQDLLGYLTPCYHLIDKSCVERHTKEAKSKMAVDGYYECQYCESYQRFSLMPIRRSILQQFRDERKGSKKNKVAQWDDTTYSGPHTKVKALIEDLKKTAAETEQLPPGEKPYKSVVFSGFTSYLDLIEAALQSAKIGFARIDGSMAVKERSTNLAVFNTVPEVTVLLVSIRAGGQGLNFTVANRAYVMEPQFNPGVEQQAVDRIHRIGQTRDVIIKHFVMKDSIEEGILKLQQKKEKLAKLSMEKKRSKREEAQERMAEIKDLFK